MEEKIHHLEQGVLSGDREAVRTACRQLDFHIYLAPFFFHPYTS